MENCYKCGGEVEQGAIAGTAGIFWTTAKGSLRMALRRERLSKGWGTPRLDAHRCPKCKLVIARY